MDEKVVEVDMDINMDELGRKELQALAKSFGIRANQTSEKIKLAILQQRKEKLPVVECYIECEESSDVDNKAVVVHHLLVTNIENEIDEYIAATNNDDSSIVVPPNDDINDTVLMPTVSSSTFSTTLVAVPIDQTIATPSVASALIHTVGEEQEQNKLILEDQGRPHVSCPALPPSSVFVSSPISDCSNNDADKTYDGDDDNGNVNGKNGDHDDNDNSHVSSSGAECYDDSDVNNIYLPDESDRNDNDVDNDDNDNEEPIEGDNVNNIIVADNEPFKASSDDHIDEQSTSIITLLSINSDDNDDNKDVSSPEGEVHGENQDDDNNNRCNDEDKDVASLDGKVHDENKDDDNNKYSDEHKDISSPDGEVYDENQDDDNDNVDSKSHENNNGEDEPIEEGDSNVNNTIVPDRKPSITSAKKDDNIEESRKSKMANEKFVTKLPKYVTVKSIVRQKKEVPLWRVHSKDFCHIKGTVRRDKGSGQIKAKPPRKQMRHPLQDRQNKKCPEPATKHYNAVTKKVVPMAMSKRNEEQMRKFLHRQSKGRQDRDKLLDAKKYAGIA